MFIPTIFLFYLWLYVWFQYNHVLRCFLFLLFECTYGSTITIYFKCSRNINACFIWKFTHNSTPVFSFILILRNDEALIQPTLISLAFIAPNKKISSFSTWFISEYFKTSSNNMSIMVRMLFLISCTFQFRIM